MAIQFYRKLGFDYVPIDVPTDFMKGELTQETLDLAPYTTGRRTFLNESTGVIQTRDDFERFPWPDPLKAFRYELLEDLGKVRPRNVGLICRIGSEGIMEIAVRLMSLRGFSVALYKDRKLVKDVCDKAGELCSSFYGYVSDLDEVDVLSLGDDMGYKSGTMAAPEFIREYMFPWHRRCVEAAHKHGKPFILHSCGNLEKVMENLIDYVRIDAKHSFQDAIKSVADAKKKYGHRIAILGGVDVDNLARFSAEDLRSYVIDLIRECAPGGGYALGSGNSIPNYVRSENYRMMIKLGMEYGKYPIA